MRGDAGLHLGVERLGGGEVEPGGGMGGDQRLGMGALAGAGAAEHEGERRRGAGHGFLSSPGVPGPRGG